MRSLQPLTSDFAARAVFASQAEIDLPEDLTSVVTRIELPQPEDKRHIYCFHADVDVSPDVDHYCEPFTNPYELAVAGRCHASGGAPTSRVQLFDRYVRNCLPDDNHAATVLLRAIAAEMAATVSSSWERIHYEGFAERFLAEHRVSLPLLDKLRSSRLIRVDDDYFSFEHEILADYFTATEIHRRHAASGELPAHLRKPRNQPLIELVLPRLSDDQEIRDVLVEAMDHSVLSRVFAGRCGKSAQAVLLRDIAALFRLAADDLESIACECHVVERDDGGRRLTRVSITGCRNWTAGYCGRLCRLVAHHLDDPVVADGFLHLLDRTEATFRRAAHLAARANRLKEHRVWEEVVHAHGGTVSFNVMTLPCTAILAELRAVLMMGGYPEGSPLWQPLLQRAVSTPGSDFALLSLFQHKHCSEDDLETILDLVRRAWRSGIYILRLHALDFLRQMPAALSDAATTRVRDTLEEFETDRIMENTVLLETLTAYGGLEAPVAPGDALAEMRSMIAANALSNCSLMKVAHALGSEPRRVLATRAYGCLANISRIYSRARTGKRMRNCRAPKNAPFLRSPWTPRTLAGIPPGCWKSFSSMATATNFRFISASLLPSTTAPPGRRSRPRHFCSRSGDVRVSWTRRPRTLEEIRPRIALGR